MTLLVTGLAIWIGLHLFKRLFPGARAALAERLGAGPVRGVISAALLGSIVLMVLGYRAMPDQSIYTPPVWGIYANIVLMYVSVFLMGAGNGKGTIREKIRHPMLAGVLVWSIGHLLANGTLADLVLFGSMGVWAIVNILVINLREGPWKRPAGGTLKGDIRTAVIAAVVYAVIAAIHYYIGPSPFGGN